MGEKQLLELPCKVGSIVTIKSQAIPKDILENGNFEDGIPEHMFKHEPILRIFNKFVN